MILYESMKEKPMTIFQTDRHFVISLKIGYLESNMYVIKQ